MTNLRAVSLLLFALLLPALPATAASPSETVDAFHKALRSNKPNEAMNYLGREAVIFEQGFISASPSEYAASELKQATEFATHTERRVIRREAWQDGNIAWVLSSTMTVGVFDGRRLDLEGAETMVLRKEGDGWKITHVHWSAHPIESGAANAANAAN